MNDNIIDKLQWVERETDFILSLSMHYVLLLLDHALIFKEDDFVSYRPVLLEYSIPAPEPVQKQGWIVSPKIPGCTGLFRLFRRISKLFGDIFISDRYKCNWVFLKKLDAYSN